MDLDQDFARLSVGPPVRAASPAMGMGPTPVNPWAGEQVLQYGNGRGPEQYQVCASCKLCRRTSGGEADGGGSNEYA